MRGHAKGFPAVDGAQAALCDGRWGLLSKHLLLVLQKRDCCVPRHVTYRGVQEMTLRTAVHAPHPRLVGFYHFAVLASHISWNKHDIPCGVGVLHLASPQDRASSSFPRGNHHPESGVYPSWCVILTYGCSHNNVLSCVCFSNFVSMPSCYMYTSEIYSSNAILWFFQLSAVWVRWL